MTLNGLKLDAWCDVITKIEAHSTISKLCKDNGMTYSHVSEIIEYFIKYKLISVEYDGREKIITLTTQGKKMIELLSKVRELIR